MEHATRFLTIDMVHVSKTVDSLRGPVSVRRRRPRSNTVTDTQTF